MGLSASAASDATRDDAYVRVRRAAQLRAHALYPFP